jgi:nucleotide-binding universal stress UspA family protein
MKILLATDGTKYSEAAVQMVSKITLAKGDRIKIISVIDMAMPLAIDIYSGYLPNTADLEKVAREQAEKTLDQTQKIISENIVNDEIVVETEILLGSPESRIVEYAEENQTDVIILGSHGYNRWERLLLGSVSDSVVHHAPCSVLVVRNPKE